MNISREPILVIGHRACPIYSYIIHTFNKTTQTPTLQIQNTASRLTSKLDNTRETIAGREQAESSLDSRSNPRNYESAKLFDAHETFERRD